MDFSLISFIIGIILFVIGRIAQLYQEKLPYIIRTKKIGIALIIAGVILIAIGIALKFKVY